MTAYRDPGFAPMPAPDCDRAQRAGQKVQRILNSCDHPFDRLQCNIHGGEARWEIEIAWSIEHDGQRYGGSEIIGRNLDVEQIGEETVTNMVAHFKRIWAATLEQIERNNERQE